MISCSLSNILGFLALYVPYVYLPSMITAKGISMEKASFIVSAIGRVAEMVLHLKSVRVTPSGTAKKCHCK